MNIDVVIPLYNGAKYIGETLSSVFGQTRPPRRVIVVDDGSTDNPGPALERFPGVRLVRSTGKGAAAARDCGFRLTRSPLVAFIDQDDLWHPSHLERLSRLIEGNPSADMTISMLKSFRDGETPGFDLKDTGTGLFDPWELYPTHDIYCTPGTALFRRAVLERAGGWPLGHEGMSDYSLLMRLAAHRPLLQTRARSLAYRVHAASTTSRLKKDPRRYLELSLQVDDELRDYFLSVRGDPGERAVVLRRSLNAHNLADLIRSLTGNDRRGAIGAIERMESALEGESFTYRTSLIRYFFYMHRSFGVGPADNGRTNYYMQLLELWPRRYRQSRWFLTKRLVDNRPGLSFYLNYCARHPLQLRRLTPLAAAFLMKTWYTVSGFTPTR